MIPEIGMNVSNGSCVGQITKVTDEYVTVSGVYYYPADDDDSGPHAEPWTEVYKREDLTNVRVWRTYPDGRVIWDFEPYRYYDEGV